jgi:hypothetical protein
MLYIAWLSAKLQYRLDKVSDLKDLLRQRDDMCHLGNSVSKWQRIWVAPLDPSHPFRTLRLGMVNLCCGWRGGRPRQPDFRKGIGALESCEQL